jgi:cellulose synthase A
MLSWQMTYGRGEDSGAPNYDKEVSHNHIPLLTNGHEVSQSAYGMLLLFFFKK